MEKINLPFFYSLGAKLKPLTEMQVSTNRIEAFIPMVRVQPDLKLLLGSFPSLTVCRRDGHDLIDAIDRWVSSWTTSEELNKEMDQAEQFRVRQIVDKARIFETVLGAELQTLATYHVTQKGIYSTPDLIERTENILPDSVRQKISREVVEEIRQSGRCLAFDNATASGFHIMRATEAVLHEYYLAVCKPKSKERLQSWGAYLSTLIKSTESDVKEVVAILQQIKDRHRNLIMHPEVVLSPDEAFTLFEIAQGAIIAMAGKLKPRKQTTKRASKA